MPCVTLVTGILLMLVAFGFRSFVEARRKKTE